MSGTNQLRIDADLNARLTAKAAEMDVPTVWLARRLLTEALDDMRPVDEIRLTRPTKETPAP